MSVYNVIQTGPKIQFGGANEGFLRLLYQVEIDENVKNDPIKPANWQINMLKTSFSISTISKTIPQ
jgi:hypothetical protein